MKTRYTKGSKWYLKAFVFSLLACAILSAQEEDGKPGFALLRQNDNISYFKEKESKAAYDKFKYRTLGEDAYLSFGGSYRGQFEYFDNEAFVEGNSDGWWLNRVMAHAHLKWNNFQAYAELNSSSVWSKEFPSPVDRDEFAVSQLFMTYAWAKWNVLIGRESPDYGARRILALREGPNVRRYFDNVKVTFSDTKITAEAFLSFPVQISPFGFDNDLLDDSEFLWGNYNTVTFKKEEFLADVYYIGRVIDDIGYSQGVANEERHSLGLRVFGEPKGLFYDFEALYQFGDFGTANIRAYTISLHAAYGFGNKNWQYEVGLKSELISGDNDPDDDVLNTFNALYPRGAYFGRVAQFGPSNLIDVHPEFSIAFNTLKLELDYVAFWRESVQDGVYGAAGILDFPDVNDERFIGHQYGAVLNWSPSPYIALEAESNVILPGGFLEQGGLDNTLFHFVFTTEFKF